MIRKLLPALLIASLSTAAAHADLTIRTTTEGSGLAKAASGPSVTYVKGLKLRTEQQAGGKDVISILDVGARKMIVLNTKKKQAEVYDMSQLADTQRQIGQSVEAKIVPRDDSREVAGYTCKGYDVEIQVDAGMPGQEGLNVVVGGPVWLSPEIPGKEEFTAFYQAAVEAGLFLGNPEAAKSQPGRERGMMELWKSLAEKGMSCTSELTVGFEGGGMLGAMMKKMNMTMTNTLQSVSTETLSDDLFSVPAGYKTKQK